MRPPTSGRSHAARGRFGPAFDWPPAAGRPAREVWYGLVSDPSRRLAIWIRYTLVATVTGHREARVWGALTDGTGDSTRFGTASHDLDALTITDSPSELTIGDSGTLTADRTAGRVETPAGPLEWEFEHPPDPVTFTPLRSERLTTVASRVLGAGRHWSYAQSVAATGTVTLDGETIHVEEGPAHRGHTVGRSSPDRWRWVHCNAFEGDLAVEALDVGGTVSVCVRTPDGVHRLNRLHHVVGPWATETREADPGRWAFAGSGDGVRVECRVAADPDHWQLASYLCPDGGVRYNAHCSLSTVDLRVEDSAGGEPLEATSDAGRAEWVDTEPPVDGSYRPRAREMGRD